MSVPYLDEVIIEPDGIGITLYGGARVYKKPGTGIVTRLHSGNTRMQVEDNSGSILGTYWDSGNLPLAWSSPTLTLGAGNTLTSPRFLLQHNTGTAGGSEFMVTAAGATSDENSGKYYWGSSARMIGLATGAWKFQKYGGGAWVTSFSTEDANLENPDMRFFGGLAIDTATASRACAFNASKQLVASATTDAQLGYLSDTTGPIQAQISARILKAGDTGVGTISFADTKQAIWKTNSDPTVDNAYLYAPLVVERLATSGTAFAAGIGFHNRGTNAALFFYDPATSKFKYKRHVTGAAITLHDSEDFSSSKVNLGESFEYTSAADDPFNYRNLRDPRGGVRTMSGVGPFGAGSHYYNVVDCRHRNAYSAGDIWGGELVWGMTTGQTRMAFRSRGSTGTPTAWTEVWTNANFDPSTKVNRAGDTMTGTLNFDQQKWTQGGAYGMEMSRYENAGFSIYRSTWQTTNTPISSLGFHAEFSGSYTMGISAWTATGWDPLVLADSVGVYSYKKHSFHQQSMSATNKAAFTTGGVIPSSTSYTTLDSYTACTLTLPTGSDGDILYLVVAQAPTTGSHRLYPPTGGSLRYTNAAGIERFCGNQGSPTAVCVLKTGLHILMATGSGIWYLQSTPD